MQTQTNKIAENAKRELPRCAHCVFWVDAGQGKTVAHLNRRMLSPACLAGQSWSPPLGILAYSRQVRDFVSHFLLTRTYTLHILLTPRFLGMKDAFKNKLIISIMAGLLETFTAPNPQYAVPHNHRDRIARELLFQCRSPFSPSYVVFQYVNSNVISIA